MFLFNFVSDLLDPLAVRFLLELGCFNEFFKPATFLLEFELDFVQPADPFGAFLDIDLR